VLMNLNGMSGDYYDYLEQASIIVMLLGIK
jgi:hypothetical protein